MWFFPFLIYGIKQLLYTFFPYLYMSNPIPSSPSVHQVKFLIKEVWGRGKLKEGGRSWYSNILSFAVFAAPRPQLPAFKHEKTKTKIGKMRPRSCLGIRPRRCVSGKGRKIGSLKSEEEDFRLFPCLLVREYAKREGRRLRYGKHLPRIWINVCGFFPFLIYGIIQLLYTFYLYLNVESHTFFPLGAPSLIFN